MSSHPFPLSAYVQLCTYLPARASSFSWRKWGLLYRNAFNPSCYDANHAVILDLSCDLLEALQEIEGYYARRLLTPRIYSGFVPGEEEQLLPLLRENGWVVEYETAEVYLHTSPCPLPADGFSFERPKELTAEVAALLLIFGGDWSLGKGEYYLAHPDCDSYAARAEDGTLASFLYIHREAGCAVIRGVVTLPEYRNRGLCTNLVRAAITDFRKSWPNMPLFLEAEDETAIRIYEKAGFTRFEAPREWTAYKPLPEDVESDCANSAEGL